MKVYVTWEEFSRILWHDGRGNAVRRWERSSLSFEETKRIRSAEFREENVELIPVSAGKIFPEKRIEE